MSILIKGMEMPNNCDVCPLIAEADDYHVCYSILVERFYDDYYTVGTAMYPYNGREDS